MNNCEFSLNYSWKIEIPLKSNETGVSYSTHLRRHCGINFKSKGQMTWKLLKTMCPCAKWSIALYFNRVREPDTWTVEVHWNINGTGLPFFTSDTIDNPLNLQKSSALQVLQHSWAASTVSRRERKSSSSSCHLFPQSTLSSSEWFEKRRESLSTSSYICDR